MARQGQRDRGLYSRPNAQGTVRWYVRIAVEGRMQTFAPPGERMEYGKLPNKS